ncbi:MFS transporter [Streptococcus equinus]|uniref:MFS transporter n=1 Tax=Streptococcus equinus TaxID=1335 RepID=UPI001FB2AFC3|nr:MFS transporter [Streptococcus equinus]UOC11722.1 MFS transporter [Streptococcus equinus]
MANNMNNFKNFIISDVCSQFSAGMLLAAMNWHAIQSYGSNGLIARLTNINLFSGFLVTLCMVKLVSKYSAKTVIISSHLIRIFFVALSLLIYCSFGKTYSSFYFLALSNGLAWNIYFPASKNLISLLSRKLDTVYTNGIAELSMQVGLFSAGLVSGILYKYIGFSMILLIGIILFVISLLSILKVNILREDIVEEKVGNKKFLSYSWSLFLIGIVLYLPFVGSNLLNTILPGYVLENLGGSSVSYGVIDMFYGIGALIAGYTIIKLSKYLKFNLLIIVLFFSSSLFTYLLIFNNSILNSCLIVLFLGFAGPSIRTLIYSEVMKKLSSYYLGELMFIWNIFNLALQILSTYLLGNIINRSGANIGFSIYGLILLFGGFTYLTIMSKFEKD